MVKFDLQLKLSSKNNVSSLQYMTRVMYAQLKVYFNSGLEDNPKVR